MDIDQPLTMVKGCGPELAKKLALLGLYTISDLIYNIPRRYDDFSNILKIDNLKPGIVTIKAKIKQVKGRYVRRGFHITEAIASDDSGSVRIVWFNQPYREESINTEQTYYLSGEFGLHYQRLSIQNPKIELVSDFPVNTARILPIYHLVQGVNNYQIRRLLREVISLIDKSKETLPEWIIKQHRFIGHAQAWHAIHFPNSSEELDKAIDRLSFEEVFALCLAAQLNRQANEKQKGLAIPFNVKLAKRFVDHLPFTLTEDQRRTVWQVYQDMNRPTPMNRLIEGDVGAGKTVVAVMVGLMAMEQGFQVAMMAPTELLARQHLETIKDLLKPLDYENQVGLLVGSLKKQAKEKIRHQIASGACRLIIGTHALISEPVKMSSLALVVIDEQHRFGVEQRQKLLAKAGYLPHLLSMTATPIPRSLALSLYGELSISLLKQKPPGRKPIITKVYRATQVSDLYKKIDNEINKGKQVFVVCPLINPSELITGPSAEEVYQQLKDKEFKHRRVGLLHGQIKNELKNKAMKEFIDHDLDILVSTTVIEVGVDVPNASIMLIQGAERFGLAQIHQLRGRVGRGQDQGYCYLITSSNGVSKRLQALESSNDGFELAELDLELRGPGAIYGQLQHGPLDLRIGSLSDSSRLTQARQAAETFTKNGKKLSDYAELAKQVERFRVVTTYN